MNLHALTDACEAVLAHAMTALDQPDAPGAPGRTFLSAGDPDADCDLLAVWATPFVKPPTALAVPQTCSILHRAQITLRRWSCEPTADGRAAVPEGSLDTYGTEFLDGLWVVWSYLAARILACDLIDGLTCAQADLVDFPGIDNEGDMAGWTLSLNLDLGPLLQTEAS